MFYLVNRKFQITLVMILVIIVIKKDNSENNFLAQKEKAIIDKNLERFLFFFEN
tara:strand:- start:148 stop:309 length:162 start_codon:yes stop_codon:yes gene_type:complete